MTLDIIIQAEPIALGPPSCEGEGAVVRFDGRVRGEEKGRPIRALIYEAYQPMAVRQMTTILHELGKSHPCLSVRVRHRIGEIAVGETAIVVEATALHRAEAFALVTAFMDRLKQDVPIWKMRAIPREL
jgi:molybdopterin synthase catalytic subunit